MREYTGQGWVREYGDVYGDAFNSWTDALQNYTEEQIARGVKACQDWAHDFPPNLGQFKQLCINTSGTNNFTDRRMALEKETGQTVETLERLAKARAGDSDLVARCKAEMAAIMAGRDTFEYLGQSVKVRSRDKAYRDLRLHARWGQ